MKTISVAPLLALMAVQSVNAHTLFSEFFVDGQAQGDGTCLRMPSDPSTATDPIASLDSSDMACGVDGTKGVPRVCPVNDGSSLSFEYRLWPGDASRGSIDISHKGPCAVYLKKVSSAVSDQGTGDGWFKIWDQGYDESAGKWCTEKLIDNGGHLSVNLPQGLQGGYYLVRPELLALHQADKGDPQFYVGCAQVYLKSEGTQLPEKTVSIPGYVGYGQPSTSFNIWNEKLALPYPMPGPAVYTPGSSNSRSKSRVMKAQSEGLEPDNTVLENANWAGIELSKYSTQDGCWNASKVCWQECTDCYDMAPPTGSSNCKIWEDKCSNIDDNCNAGNYNGPPDYMKNLTPKVKQVELPAAVGAQQGDGSYQPSTARSVSAPASDDNSDSSSNSGPDNNSNSDNKVSEDGSCGNGITCQGSTFGNCCSSHGYCGSSSDYCSSGCQPAFGTCGNSAQKREFHSHSRVHAHHRRYEVPNVVVGRDSRVLK